MTTIGLSPKTVLAFLFPLIAALGTAAASWVVTGDFNDTEIRAALGGVILSGVAALGAYRGDPGNMAPAVLEPGSDEHLTVDPAGSSPGVIS